MNTIQKAHALVDIEGYYVLSAKVAMLGMINFSVQSVQIQDGKIF